MKRILSIAALSALIVGLIAVPASATDFEPLPHLVKNIMPGATSSQIGTGSSGRLGSRLLFSSDTVGKGRELWTTDGTAAGTKLVKDINPGIGESVPDHFVGFKGKLFFVASDSDHGNELWTTDGTAAGTKRVSDIRPGFLGSDPEDLTVAGTNLFFTADTDGSGRELWMTNGTSTTLVKDINQTVLGSGTTEIVALGSKILFNAEATAAEGNELWTSDGTAVGTKLLNNIYGGSGNASSPSKLTRSGSKVFFTAADSTHGRELWVTDGDPFHTAMASDINLGLPSSDPDQLFAYDGRLIFRATRPGEGVEPWISDGTALGTTSLGNLDTGNSGNDGSGAHDFTLFKGAVYFQAGDVAHGSEMWVTRGNQGSTHLFKDTFPGSGHGEPGDFRAVGPLLVFSTYMSDAIGSELWASDGTIAGTKLRKNIYPGNMNSSFPNMLGTIGNTELFVADEPTHGQELWAYTTRSSTTKGYPKSHYSKSTDKHHKIYLTVKVRATSTTPSGKVVLKSGSHIIGSAALHSGNAKIRITKKLGKGTHHIRAYYYGSVYVQTSKSSYITIKVK